jgi:hypothetical protein
VNSKGSVAELSVTAVIFSIRLLTFRSRASRTHGTGQKSVTVDRKTTRVQNCQKTSDWVEDNSRADVWARNGYSWFTIGRVVTTRQ